MITAIKNNYNKIHNSIINITNYKYFNEFYCAIFMFIALFGWRFNDIIGISVLLALSAIILILTNDLNYILPAIINLLFVINTGFLNNEIPITIIIFIAIFIIILLTFLIINIKHNGFKFKKMKSFWGLLGLAVMNLLPIFWCDTISDGYEVFYFLFFADFAYLLLYFLVIYGLKKVDLKLLSVSMSYLGILISLECVYMAYDLKDTAESIFDLWYYMGWGLCNEAGIMICFALPFIFYLMAKSEKILSLILQSFKILILAVGVLLTTSRGSYLCFGLEFIVLAIALVFVTKIRKQYLLYVGVILILAIGGILLLHNYTFPLIEEAYDAVFVRGLDDNGRVELWEKAITSFKESPLTIIFGPGYCHDIGMHTTDLGEQLVPMVSHSTFFQTLAMGGIFGILMLLLHLFEKYRNTIKLGLPFILTIGLGFICVDLYGLIDNTYHMYYYMIPLVITLAVMDNALDKKVIKNDKSL